MRFCITVFALIVFAFPSWSIDNEGLYKTCAPYADRGFNAEEIEDLTCISYILATIDHARNVCNFANTVRKYKRNDEINWTQGEVDGAGILAYSFGTTATYDDQNAIIQSFLNWAKQNPSKWGHIPDASNWMSSLWPCTPE